MADTTNLVLPLLAAAQAQKHVTLNEALLRLDALVMLTAVSRTSATPPSAPVEGDRYIVPAGATGAWAGRDAEVAIFLNGGWDFATAQEGWTAWVADELVELRFTGGGWTTVAGGGGGGTPLSSIEATHTIVSGPGNQTAAVIPANSLVFGVTARVMADVIGPGAWSLGVDMAEGRYGQGIGLAVDSEAPGVTGAPLAYLNDTPIRVTAEGSDFTSGVVRIAIHYLSLPVPS